MASEHKVGENITKKTNDDLDVVILTQAPYAAWEYPMPASVKDSIDKQELGYRQVVQRETHQLALDISEMSGGKIRAAPVGWDDATGFDWSKPSIIVIRTIWDYFYRFPEFSQWLKQFQDMSNKAPLFVNSVETMHWNIDKHYMKELRDQGGIHICPTVFVEPGTLKSKGLTITQFLQSSEECPREWGLQLVVKPCVSGSARETFKVTLPPPQEDRCKKSDGRVIYKTKDEFAEEDVDARYATLNETEAFMIQPFMKSIVEKGEVSVVVIDGKVTHAILKQPQGGDFRVQYDYGGRETLHTEHLTEKMKQLAIDCVAAASRLIASKTQRQDDSGIMYARVDIFEDNEGKWALAELEVIEPELWFLLCPEAGTRLAEGVVRKFNDLTNTKKD